MAKKLTCLTLGLGIYCTFCYAGYRTRRGEGEREGEDGSAGAEKGQGREEEKGGRIRKAESRNDYCLRKASMKGSELE